MESLVLENERLIEKFNKDEYLNLKLYQIAAALSALETTNEIQKNFISKRKCDLSKEDHILRLYALLQGLFVSIDSLYSLTLAITKSKSYININNNKDIRQIKYIRNDVVGHPSNRLLNSDQAYCILDNSSIDSYKFSYKIYSLSDTIIKTINIDDLLYAYYKESNSLLIELYKIANYENTKLRLKSEVSLMLDYYLMGKDYKEMLEIVISKYKNKYKDASKEQHRVLWRYHLINRLEGITPQDTDEADLIEYCIGLELVKIYESLTGLKYSFKKKLPKYVSGIYKFFKQDKNLVNYLDYLKDTDHPLFAKCLNSLIEKSKNNNNAVVTSYLLLINKYLKQEDLELVYAINLPIKEYIKK